MTEPQMQAIELEILQPGRPTGQYRPVNYETLKLEKVVVPDAWHDFDLAILPKTLTPEGEPLIAILFSQISHPAQTIVAARLIGGMQNGDANLYLLAVPEGDPAFSTCQSIQDIPDDLRSKVLNECPVDTGDHPLTWLPLDTIESRVHKAYVQYRQARAVTERTGSSPAWKPSERQNRQADYTEASHYTDAEYTFFQLPYHFQHYVEAYLSPDERILYALRRPAIYSQRQRTWLSRTKLQEGVLILTNQRLLHLVELTPLGDSGVRYGFNAQMGVLERLYAYSVEPAGQETLLLKTQWTVRQGTQILEWEFPTFVQGELKGLLVFLEKFLPEQVGHRALQRASAPPSPDQLPRLADPAANDPTQVDAVNDRFASRLGSWLEDGEQFKAWALWPAWFDKRSAPEVLLVTDQRIRIISECDRPAGCKLEISLADLATLEYVSSILSSYIGLSWVLAGQAKRSELKFPYSAEGTFRSCMEAIRRCTAVLVACR